MTTSRVPQRRQRVRCFICLAEFDWDEAPEEDLPGAAVVPAAAAGADAGAPPADVSRMDSVHHRGRRCPNPFNDPTHWLPNGYASHGDPIVVGVIGESQTGKSHLIASMMWALTRREVGALGLSTAALNINTHHDYMTSVVDTLFVQGKELRVTPPLQIGYVDGLRLTNGSGGQRVVAFFDVSGDALPNVSVQTRFISAVNALMFVADATKIPGLVGSGTKNADVTFEHVLNRLVNERAQEKDRLDLPSVIVLNKSDTIVDIEPVHAWLTRNDQVRRVDAETVLRESREVWALMSAYGGNGWLGPSLMLNPCALHFVSATGGSPRDKRFPYGVRPAGVLRALATLLAMKGVLDPDHVSGPVGF